MTTTMKTTTTYSLTDLRDAIAAIAAAMVEMDRASGDCTADVLDDADAGDASGWNADGVLAAAEIADVDGVLAAAIAREYMPLVRDAYAKAWRAAVEADLAARDEDAA